MFLFEGAITLRGGSMKQNKSNDQVRNNKTMSVFV